MINDRSLCVLIKAEMKKSHLTAEKFAANLKVPLPTLKRWLRGEGVSLNSWVKMLNGLGLSLSDVASTFNDPTAQQFEYTARQEKEFVAVPGLLAFFQELLNGKQPNEIAQFYKLKPRSVTFYLKKLDSIELIAWKDGLAAKVKKSGEPRWRKNGELSKHFRGKVFRELVELNRDTVKIGLYELPETELVNLKRMIDEAFLFAQQTEKKARLSQRPTTSVGFASIATAYSPDFLKRIPEKP